MSVVNISSIVDEKKRERRAEDAKVLRRYAAAIESGEIETFLLVATDKAGMRYEMTRMPGEQLALLVAFVLYKFPGACFFPTGIPEQPLGGGDGDQGDDD